MTENGHITTLKDGAELLIRPLKDDELEPYFRFFSELSKEDIAYLQVDVSDPEVVKQRIKTNPQLNVFRVVALDGDRIVADANLRWPQSGWMAHVGDIRVIIAKDFRRRGLASILYRRLFIQAVKEDLEKLEAQMMPQQESARKCVEKLGFREEGVLPKFVQDVDGNLQDLVIMSARVEGF